MNKSRCGGAGCGADEAYKEYMNKGLTGRDVFKSMVIEDEACNIPEDVWDDLATYGLGCFNIEWVSPLDDLGEDKGSVRDYNVGNSDYAQRRIQPWDIWLEYNLNPWDADIIKRVLRNKKGEERSLDYQKIKHICDERIRQLEADGGDDE
jgi:hypothetical protein